MAGINITTSLDNEARTGLQKLSTGLSKVGAVGKTVGKKLTSSLGKAAGGIKKMGSAVFSLKGGMVALGAVAVAGLVKKLAGIVTGSIDVADSIDKVSKAANISASALQGIRHAANLSGVGMTKIDEALKKFNKRLGEFNTTGAGPAKQGFEQLGIATKDVTGEVRSTEDVFNDAINSLANIKDASEQAAVASSLFGVRVGPDLVPLLKEGSKGIVAMRGELDKYGAVMSDEMIKTSVKAKDALTRMSTVVGAKFNVIIAKAAPLIIKAADAMLSFVNTIDRAVDKISRFNFFGRSDPSKAAQAFRDKMKREMNPELVWADHLKKREQLFEDSTKTIVEDEADQRKKAAADLTASVIKQNKEQEARLKRMADRRIKIAAAATAAISKARKDADVAEETGVQGLGITDANIMEGLASAGAVVGGVMLELMNKFFDMVLSSKAVRDALDEFEAAVKPLAELIGDELAPIIRVLTNDLIIPLVEILKPYVRILGATLLPIMRALAPVFRTILIIATELGPVIRIIAILLRALTPVLALLADVIAGVLIPVFRALGPLLEAIAIILEPFIPILKTLTELVALTLLPQLAAINAAFSALEVVTKALASAARVAAAVLKTITGIGGGGGGGGGGGLIPGIPGLAHGGTAIATRPTLITLGENGPERLDVSPLASGGHRGGSPTVVFNGPVIFDELAMERFERKFMQRLNKQANRRV